MFRPGRRTVARAVALDDHARLRHEPHVVFTEGGSPGGWDPGSAAPSACGRSRTPARGPRGAAGSRAPPDARRDARRWTDPGADRPGTDPRSTSGTRRT